MAFPKQEPFPSVFWSYVATQAYEWAIRPESPSIRRRLANSQSRFASLSWRSVLRRHRLEKLKFLFRALFVLIFFVFRRGNFHRCVLVRLLWLFGVFEDLRTEDIGCVFERTFNVFMMMRTFQMDCSGKSDATVCAFAVIDCLKMWKVTQGTLIVRKIGS